MAIGGNLEDLASKRGQIGNNIRINTASDLNAYTKAGNWLFSDAAAGENFPNIGRGGELNCYVSTTAIFQFFTEFNNNRRYIRYGIPNSEQWSGWVQFVSVAQIGDGIRNTNGIISVPEYEGATASSAGTSGLVPPAAAGQQNHLLTGGGAYISKVPNATHADTADNVTHADTADNATHADTADNSFALAGRTWWESLYTDSAGWLIGSVDEKLRPVNTGSLKVLAATYANSAATANTATGLTYTFTKNKSLVLPPGGTWFVLNWWDGDGGTAKGNWSGGQTVAGGSSVGVGNGAFALRVA